MKMSCTTHIPLKTVENKRKQNAWNDEWFSFISKNRIEYLHRKQTLEFIQSHMFCFVCGEKKSSEKCIIFFHSFFH